MSPSDRPHEIEAKFRLASREELEARLRALGACPQPVEHESNVLFDDAKGTLRARGGALRLRTVEGRGLLTLKGQAVLREGVKSRLELESAVESPERVGQILEELGYSPAFVYEKRRTTWRFPQAGRPLVVVDETPLGLFAEIEGEEEEVREMARELGVSEGEFLAESYAALYEAARANDPSLPRDMMFSSARKPR